MPLKCSSVRNFANVCHVNVVTATHFSLLLRELHVVEYSKDDAKEIMPPVLLKGVSVTLHDLKHDGQTPETHKQTF